MNSVLLLSKSVTFVNYLSWVCKNERVTIANVA